jgi:uncharacterized protein involved in type VI secretion and phage assembly
MVTKEEMIQHGAAIERLLGDKAVQAVFGDIQEKYYQQWKEASSPELREHLWFRARAVDDLKLVLEAAVVSGQHEQAAMDDAELRARRQA